MIDYNAMRELVNSYRKAPWINPPAAIMSLEFLMDSMGITELRVVEIQSTPRGAIATVSLLSEGSMTASVAVRGRSVRTLKQKLQLYKEYKRAAKPIPKSSDAGIYFHDPSAQNIPTPATQGINYA